MTDYNTTDEIFKAYGRRLRWHDHPGSFHVFTSDKHHLAYSRDILRQAWDEYAGAPAKRAKANP
ncbi:MAG TPA: hypothetical protein VK327_03290 [Candidatus Paceibacterota bacterium]|nr:hypothetical protein [Candidatus Paceibacterota bacterium]